MREIKDYFYYKAKKENYPARSVYKLEEIDKSYHIFKKGFKVLDLGCSPGGWTKYCSEKVGGDGKVVGVDKQELKLHGLENVVFLEEDIFKLDIEKIKQSSPNFDVVLSDMAPSTTGIREVDQARSLELAKQAFSIAQKLLKPKGHFVCKIFQGQDVKAFLKEVELHFETVKIVKPESSRKESFEVFITALCKRGLQSAADN